MEHKTNLETNKHYTFECCRIKRDNTVVCWNSAPLMTWLLNDGFDGFVEIWIDERGLLHIESNKHNANYILSNYRLNIR